MLKDTFLWPVRVYYEDTDAAGIVYHANYLRFMERARTEWLRTLGFEQDALAREHGVVFVIIESTLAFKRAARFNDELVVRSALERLRGATIEFAQSVTDLSGTALCTARNVVACVTAGNLQPRRIPAHMMEIFKGGD
ncbi:MAG: tol-pal system-associated acyl-CoA thioesterase [Gammaproteobacteria bacterium]|nr:tol-pal system-associated acyl-CoA thioesterase [Gammaproteobacteria bacterium]